MEKVIDGYTQLYLSILWYGLKKDKIWFKINLWEIYVPFFDQLNLSMFLVLKKENMSITKNLLELTKVLLNLLFLPLILGS